MAARKCLKCGSAFPADGKGKAVKCPICPDEPVLQYASMATPDTDWPPEVKEVLPTLTPDEEEEWSADWCALEAEVARRGPKWSLADVIGEGVRRPT